MPSSEVICDSFSAETLTNGKVKLQIFQKTPGENTPNSRLSVKQVAERISAKTGQEVSDMTIYRWAAAKKNRLPHHRFCGRIFFVAQEVDRWVEAQVK